MERLQGAQEKMTRVGCMSMALCLVLLLHLSLGHTSEVTAAPAPPPKTISIDVQGTDVRDVLRLLAETGGVNILASGEVQGTMTVRLVDVPWEQALEAVLKLTGLAQERQGNVILVAPAERFRSAREERVRAHQAEAQTEPKMTRVVPVNYANATQLKATLEKLLGVCATIAVDGRTNTLILSGTPSCLRVWEGAH
jgi:type II secretory pathway component HofQ